MEGRGCHVGTPLEGQMAGTMRPEPISTRREWIAELASREPKWRLTTLAHHIDRTWLLEAWRKTRKDGATGHSCAKAGGAVATS